LQQQRRLAAILVADVAGYSRLMEADEVGTLAALKERQNLILEPTVCEYGGRIVKVMGDGVLAEFASVANAVAGAIDLQRVTPKTRADNFNGMPFPRRCAYLAICLARRPHTWAVPTSPPLTAWIVLSMDANLR
jgi:class 3 adenylate cyclase